MGPLPCSPARLHLIVAPRFGLSAPRARAGGEDGIDCAELRVLLLVRVLPSAAADCERYGLARGQYARRVASTNGKTKTTSRPSGIGKVGR